MAPRQKWLLLLYGLPTGKNAARVNLWRRLKKCGALPIKTSVYILPDESRHHERLQWLAQQVRDRGGEATIAHASEIEGLPHEDIIRQFNEARAADYSALIPALNRLISKRRKHFEDGLAASLERLTQRADGNNNLEEAGLTALRYRPGGRAPLH